VEVKSRSVVGDGAVVAAEDRQLATVFQNIADAMSDEYAEQVLQWSKAAVLRSCIMRGGNGGGGGSLDIRGVDLVSQIFAVLCTEFGQNFVKRLMGLACTVLAKSVKDPNATTPSTFFVVVKAVSDNVKRIQTHFQKVVLPQIEHAPTAVTVCTECKRSVLVVLEATVVQGLEQSFDALLHHLEQLLRQQDRSDYMPKEMLMDATPSCLACVSCLRRQYENINACFGSSPSEVQLGGLWRALVAKFALLLRSHLKSRFVRAVDPTGAIALMRDIDTYRDAVRRYKSDKADAEFAELHELASLLMIPPEHLPSLVQEGDLAKMASAELQDFIRMRSDYKQSTSIFNVATYK
jgi:hypothetical protein